MKKLNENEIEQTALEMLGKLGFEDLFGPEIGPDGNPSTGSGQEREDYAQVVLNTRLAKVIKSINKGLPDDCVQEVIKKVQSFSSPDLIVNNEQFHKYLFDGVGVEYKKLNGEIKHDIVRIIDFDNIENNDFLAVNQFKIIENRENRRPDIVIFINGLPLVIIELKNPENPTADIQGAFDQLQTYKQLIPSIFQYNELLIISDGIEARAGTITSDWERFMPWKTIDGEKIIGEHEPQMKVMIEGMLNKRVLLDLIHHYVVFEKTRTGTLKKVAAYHQYYAVNKAIEATMRAMGKHGVAPSSPALLPGGEGGESSALNPQPWQAEDFMVAEKNYRGGFYFSGLIKEARTLRKKQTKAEEFLWNIIRNKQFMGLKFRRQHQIGKYIVDFYCDEKKLIIELDGEVHESEKQKKHDKTRDKYLTTLGNKVLRFANNRIFDDIETVLENIANLVFNPLPGPLPKGEGNSNRVSNYSLSGDLYGGLVCQDTFPNDLRWIL
jgi:very-short-patch-repair endonuclease